ncbi:MetQ/NlpA family ABC transporter substrate-binding protein [Sulfitobacter faviae]|uniref:MetQ/NlpA family ABC transporter substrate-binding protein n=1 Tax=Sulfitobacter faviae TaxID=1775881 RepID=UPI00398D080D
MDLTENPEEPLLQRTRRRATAAFVGRLDAALINTNYAIASGLTRENTMAMESAENPYVNIIAVRKGDEEAAWVETLLKAYHSDEIKTFINESYQGTVITSW